MDRNTNFNPFCEEPAFGKRQWLVDFQHAIRLPQHSLESSPSLLPAQRQGPNHPVCFAACVRNLTSPPRLHRKADQTRGRARAQAGKGLVSRSVAGKVAESDRFPSRQRQSTGKTNDTVPDKRQGHAPQEVPARPEADLALLPGSPGKPPSQGKAYSSRKTPAADGSATRAKAGSAVCHATSRSCSRTSAKTSSFLPSGRRFW